jgi:hypothetical protein
VAAGFGSALERFEGFGHGDAVNSNRDRFCQVEIGDDFELGLIGEGAKNGGEGFIFKVQRDGSPPAMDPET